jgi:hypothetical protein
MPIDSSFRSFVFYVIIFSNFQNIPGAISSVG